MHVSETAEGAGNDIRDYDYDYTRLGNVKVLDDSVGLRTKMLLLLFLLSSLYYNVKPCLLLVKYLIITLVIVIFHFFYFLSRCDRFFYTHIFHI